MAEKSTIARPYAQAIFNLAKAENNLKDWSDKLALLTEVVSNDGVIQLIVNPEVEINKIIDLIIDVCQDGLDEQGINFLKIAAQNKRLQIIPEVAEAYEILRADEEGNIKAEVISAFAVNTTQKNSIKAALKQRLGREITLTTRTDKSLLGGIIIRAGDLVIDGSVENQLNRFTNSLMS